MSEEKYKNHPFFTDHRIIIEAFNSLIKDNEEAYKLFREYGFAPAAVEQLNWEKERIKQVKKKVLDALYHNK